MRYVNQEMSGALFRDCDISRAKFDDVDLSGATFQNVDLAGAAFINCDLSETVIEGVSVDAMLKCYKQYGNYQG